jgi:hypothetical protein
MGRYALSAAHVSHTPLPTEAPAGQRVVQVRQDGLRGRYEITITSQTISLQPLMPSTVCDVTVIHLQRLSG